MLDVETARVARTVYGNPSSLDQGSLNRLIANRKYEAAGGLGSGEESGGH
jgi:hypothetical protein